VKTDRKDAELLARLGLAGQLSPIAVPSQFVEAVRHLMRAREQLRGDLLRARHRVSKPLLLHGRVYPEPTTWNRAHRRWLGRQRFAEQATDLAFIDLLGAVDGLVARKESLDERLSRLAQDERLWPTVARLRAFRGLDTLTALALHLELGGDWRPNPKM
jgi:transposase